MCRGHLRVVRVRFGRDRPAPVFILTGAATVGKVPEAQMMALVALSPAWRAGGVRGVTKAQRLLWLKP